MMARANDFVPALGKALGTLRSASEENSPERRVGRTLLGFRELLRYEDHEDFSESERPVLEAARLKAIQFLMDNLPDPSEVVPGVWTKYYTFLSVEGAETRELLQTREPEMEKVWEEFCSQLPQVLEQGLGHSRN